jgi:hypothetical protein
MITGNRVVDELRLVVVDEEVVELEGRVVEVVAASEFAARRKLVPSRKIEAIKAT